jgi:Reverse transcriptase (RNA-dependent DNA polymerase)
MEFLTKRVTQALQEGQIRGIQLAEGVPRLTLALYTDDLVVLGEAETREVEAYETLLEEFGTHLGLKVNLDKSKF